VADLVEVVDFAPSGGPAQGWELDGRCSVERPSGPVVVNPNKPTNCVTTSFGASGYATSTYEIANDSRAAFLDIGVIESVRSGGPNRAMLVLQGNQVVVCLNGKCWSGALRFLMDKPGYVEFSVVGNDSRHPAAVTVKRFLVFRAV
jgi:hypothetical protein